MVGDNAQKRRVILAFSARRCGNYENLVSTQKISSADAHAYLTLGVCFNNKSCKLYNKGVEHGFSCIKVMQDPCQKITKCF